MSYFYLASPYSHPDPIIRELRFLAVEAATHHLMRKGLIIFSPIVYTHALAKKNSLPFTAGHWSEFNHMMLKASSGLRILMLSGWQQSQGVGRERGWAQQLNIETRYFYPADAGVTEIEKALSKLA